MVPRYPHLHMEHESPSFFNNDRTDWLIRSLDRSGICQLLSHTKCTSSLLGTVWPDEKSYLDCSVHTLVAVSNKICSNPWMLILKNILSASPWLSTAGHAAPSVGHFFFKTMVFFRSTYSLMISNTLSSLMKVPPIVLFNLSTFSWTTFSKSPTFAPLTDWLIDWCIYASGCM